MGCSRPKSEVAWVNIIANRYCKSKSSSFCSLPAVVSLCERVRGQIYCYLVAFCYTMVIFRSPPWPLPQQHRSPRSDAPFAGEQLGDALVSRRTESEGGVADTKRIGGVRYDLSQRHVKQQDGLVLDRARRRW